MRLLSSVGNRHLFWLKVGLVAHLNRLPSMSRACCQLECVRKERRVQECGSQPSSPLNSGDSLANADSKLSRQLNLSKARYSKCLTQGVTLF